MSNLNYPLNLAVPCPGTKSPFNHSLKINVHKYDLNEGEDNVGGWSFVNKTYWVECSCGLRLDPTTRELLAVERWNEVCRPPLEEIHLTQEELDSIKEDRLSLFDYMLVVEGKDVQSCIGVKWKQKGVENWNTQLHKDEWVIGETYDIGQKDKVGAKWYKVKLVGLIDPK